MTRDLENPELDRLVRELNRSGPTGERSNAPVEQVEVEPGLPPTTLFQVAEGDPLERALKTMVRRGASDLLILADTPWMLRVHGQLQPMDAPTFSHRELHALFANHLDARTRTNLAERGSADFSLRLAGPAGDDNASLRPGRFRINLHRQRGQLAAAVRSLPEAIPTLSSLNLPASLAKLVEPRRGLVLICGPTGSGKSSTLAALVGEINRARRAHVITIEDPVEYEHQHGESVIEHIEIGQDAPSYAEALRSCLRQDPDVILVGEMRDLETIATALTAAETGHLILSTLHTNDAVQAVHRLVDVFPANRQSQIRHQLALCLNTIVSQQLIPRANGRGRVPALELLTATYPVRQQIRSEKLQKLYNEITLGQRHGMVSLEASLAELVRSQAIDVEEAMVRTQHQEELESLLRSG